MSRIESSSSPSWPPTPAEPGYQYTPEATTSETDETLPLHAVNVAPRWNESKATIWKVTWIYAIFLFLYGGIEVAIGGWIIVFITNVRHGDPFQSGMAEIGFWLSITVSRFVLGFMSPRIGEKLSIAIYILLAIALELIFWLVPEFIVSAVAVAFVGFFMGTIFLGVVIVATRLLPKNLHVAAIGFAAAFSMGGGAVFPFMIGAIAQAKGVTVLQPVLLAMLAVSLGIWTMMFRLPQHEVSYQV
ncbi:Major facilitator superfamily domain, general substrate transporter [Penicillium italicum]|uniref:Major facilitator superfamily domain, general substrate transporter n=1 Tax=Penicillium italicum TaxID=40296 RepID=A0A0A2LIM8_PENIT|nr:Major facilitator superfamily domain, general substrate transporter [Penicillium italicum]